METWAPLGLPPIQGRPDGMRATALAAAGVYSDGHVDSLAFVQKGVQLSYHLVWWALVAQLLLMNSKHYRSRNGILICLITRTVPALVMEWTTKGVTIEQTISDGL